MRVLKTCQNLLFKPSRACVLFWLVKVLLTSLGLSTRVRARTVGKTAHMTKPDIQKIMPVCATHGRLLANVSPTDHPSLSRARAYCSRYLAKLSF